MLNPYNPHKALLSGTTQCFTGLLPFIPRNKRLGVKCRTAYSNTLLFRSDLLCFKPSFCELNHIQGYRPVRFALVGLKFGLQNCICQQILATPPPRGSSQYPNRSLAFLCTGFLVVRQLSNHSWLAHPNWHRNLLKYKWNSSCLVGRGFSVFPNRQFLRIAPSTE